MHPTNKSIGIKQTLLFICPIENPVYPPIDEWTALEANYEHNLLSKLLAGTVLII